MRNIEELNEWWTSGRLIVDHPGGYETIADDKLGQWIESIESTYRFQLPADLPELNVAAAIWACKQVIRAAQLSVYRELGEDFIKQGLEWIPSWLPNSASSVKTQETFTSVFATLPEHHYSVDLFFRFLPDLFRLTQVASPSDPLLAYLQQWATIWPLSGNGISGVTVCEEAVQVVQRTRGLRILYRERSLARSQAIIR